MKVKEILEELSLFNENAEVMFNLNGVPQQISFKHLTWNIIKECENTNESKKLASSIELYFE